MIPRIIIAGTHSGCGKTTLASALMSALTTRGLTVQPFKVGPDFIDPTHHTAICKRYSRNLDPYMMGKEGVINTLRTASEGADIAIIEGVMGMYDGLEGSDFGSTAHLAKLTETPVLLTVDVKGMSRSANAIVKGYKSFDNKVNIAGLLFNRVGSPRHRQMIEDSLKSEAVGWIPWKRDKSVHSRHLGLKMAHETTSMGEFGRIIEENCNIDRIIEIARSAPELTIPKTQTEATNKKIKKNENQPYKLHLGVAYDSAFCFYYQDNLDLLRRNGVKLVFFSPISDHLPDVDALYLGGGYPEMHGEALEKSPCRAEIKTAIENGMPVYAECGGLLYLTRSIEDSRNYKMVGVLNADAVKKDKFQALGYVEAECTGGTSVLNAGIGFRGHEFHYSVLECDPDVRFALTLKRGKGIIDGYDGIYEHNVLACYTHAYFTKEFAASFLDNISKISNHAGYD